MPRRFQRCDRADEITCTPPLGDAAIRAPTPVFVWFLSAFWQTMLWRRGPASFGPPPSPPPRAASSPCANGRFQGSPSIPQLALAMPTGSQRRAASTRLNECKCRALAPTISAMTSCRPRCLEDALRPVGQRQTACRPGADKRQLQRFGCPLSRSKRGGRVLQ